MATKKRTEIGVMADGAIVSDPAPSFTLRASRPGHLRALMRAAEELQGDELRGALETLREFELYEERQR